MYIGNLKKTIGKPTYKVYIMEQQAPRTPERLTVGVTYAQIVAQDREARARARASGINNVGNHTPTVRNLDLAGEAGVEQNPYRTPERQIRRVRP